MPKNIILVVMDTLRKDHCSLYGYERRTTPYLDKFASENDFWDGIIANSCWSPPSHASLLTGKFPFEHGTTALDPYMRDDQYLPLLLKNKGYTTVGISNNPWISSGFGWNRGFDYFKDFVDLEDENLLSTLPLTLTNYSKLLVLSIWGLKNPLKLLRAIPTLVSLIPRSLGLSDGGGRKTNEHAFSKLKDTNEPFFLFINYMDIHEPHRSRIQNRHFSSIKDRLTGNKNYRDRFNPPKPIKSTINLYDDSIRNIDRQIEKLIDFLKSEGLYEDSIIVLTSDHGQQFSKNHLGHTPIMTPDVLEVPLITKNLPLEDNPASLRDIYHGLKAGAGLEQEEKLDNIALAEVYGTVRTKSPDTRPLSWWKRYEAVIHTDDGRFQASSLGKRNGNPDLLQLMPRKVRKLLENGLPRERGFEINL